MAPLLRSVSLGWPYQ